MIAGLHVLFRVADAEYAVSAADVLHMESFTGATHVPGTEHHVVGVMQIRQRVVPIIDMRRRFGLPDVEATLDSRVVVVEVAARTVGLLVDSAREVVRLGPDAFEPTPDVVAQRAHGFVASLARTGERLLMLVDLPKIIGQATLGEETYDGE